MRSCVLVAAALGFAACTASAPADDRATVSLTLAALDLGDVGDVVWDIEVVNGASPAGVVWRERITSSRFGDGAGSATYIGTCDATPAVRDNLVRVWVVGAYAAPVASPGAFGDPPPAGAIAFENPTPWNATDATWATPLTQGARCVENADVAVQFDVTLLRPARQGFFDVAVDFADVFCSAKLDCCKEDATGACASDLDLLFDAAGHRESTVVLGFACTGGVGANVDTTLYFDDLELDCTDPAAGFDADVVINPARAAGNQCTAGALSGCAAVTERHGVDADTWLYQIAVYRGLEALTSNGAAGNKVYWNVALGVKKPAVGACRLRARGTADDGLATVLTDNGEIAPGAVYPFIAWDADLGTCKAEPLGSDSVATHYTTTTGTGTSFDYGYGATHLPGPFCEPECVHGTCVWGECECDEGWGDPACATPDCGDFGQCPAGFVCLDETWCTSADGSEVLVPASDFWMGCNPALDGNCDGLEHPQHQVSLSAYAIDRTKVTAAAYKICVGAGACSLPAITANAHGTYDPAGKQTHPINYVSWYQAGQYCAWRGQRLCSEAEWEKASRGGCETVSGECRTSMRKYPWGNYEPSGCNELSWEGCPSGSYTWPSTAFPGGASVYGALEMSGNLLEWTNDLFAEYPAAPQTNPPGPNPGDPGVSTGRVLRSSAWNDPARYARSSRRTNQPPAVQDNYIGFRCCRSL